MRNVSDKSRRGNEDTFLCSRSVFNENGAVYEVMWGVGGNLVGPVLSRKDAVFMPLN